MEDNTPLTLPFWNKVDVDNLTIEIRYEDDRIFVSLLTNNVNVLNKKIELDNTEEVKVKLQRILDLASKISDNYYGKNYDEFKKLSQELLQQVNLL
jgi:hypothetical protein